MAEYIEREATIDAIEGTTWYHISCQKNLVEGAACEADALYKATDIYNVIRSAPIADVVEVVRCKDCLYATERYGHLTCINGISYRNHWNNPDDFCNHGVRRYGDTE